MECNKKTSKNYKINIMLYSDGASSHILAEKIIASEHTNKFYVAGHNSFVKNMGISVDIDDMGLINFAKENDVQLFICDSEINSNGITSAFIKAGIPSLGVTKKWARLEGSKVFGKKFASDFSIPVPKYMIISSSKQYKDVFDEFSFPLVVKSDGYSKGLGVHIVDNEEEFKCTCNKLLSTFSSESDTLPQIIVEEFITGDEISYITVWNGSSLIPVCCIKDYKKLDKNSNINTSSMGAYYSPNLLNLKKQKLLNDYHKKLEEVLIKLKPDFTGPIYSGIIFTEDSYYVLEYNMRFGTTESAIIFSNLKMDFVDFALSLVQGKLDTSPFNDKRNVSTVVLYTDGYPYDNFSISKIPVSIIDKIKNDSDGKIDVYFNKVIIEDNNYILNCDSSIFLVAKDFSSFIYSVLDKIEFVNIRYRKDIGS